MKKIIWTGLVAGVAMAIVNAALNPIFNALFPWLQDAYMNNPVFRPWDDPIMMLFFLYPILLGLALAYVWDKTKNLFKGSVVNKGLNFGLIFFFVVGLPTFLINFSSFNLPLVMILSWTFMSLVNGFVAGFVLAKLNK
jgi:hypothetical protein